MDPHRNQHQLLCAMLQRNSCFVKSKFCGCKKNFIDIVTVQGVSGRLPFLRLHAKQEAIATAHIPRNIRRSLKKASHGYSLNCNLIYY